ncbi:hypothetical protein [Sphingobacterium faecale]|nr:hypothetical protein [Sphingobacterium faecale]
MDRYKRDYKFRSDEGADSGKDLKWLIIGGALVVIALAYFIG